MFARLTSKADVTLDKGRGMTRGHLRVLQENKTSEKELQPLTYYSPANPGHGAINSYHQKLLY